MIYDYLKLRLQNKFSVAKLGSISLFILHSTIELRSTYRPFYPLTRAHSINECICLITGSDPWLLIILFAPGLVHGFAETF